MLTTICLYAFLIGITNNGTHHYCGSLKVPDDRIVPFSLKPAIVALARYYRNAELYIWEPFPSLRITWYLRKYVLRKDCLCSLALPSQNQVKHQVSQEMLKTKFALAERNHSHMSRVCMHYGV
ncbi:hypothetical protein QCA50_006469 [Cerrena zonata]|uniref:Secreted protein n=1 Tax=Cerrena zonata TaxID=2478898 RepID=A0AAW0GL69_9APHY